MAQINIVTTEEEQNSVLEVIKENNGSTLTMATIGNLSGINPNRVRYVIADLLEAGKISREPTKAYNKHYVRYSYSIVE